MPNDATEQWNWPRISKGLKQAAVETIQEVTEAAANDARGNVAVLSGELRDSIAADTTRQQGDTIEGAFGSYGRRVTTYAATQETRRPYLRPAADRAIEALVRIYRAKVKRVK